MVDPSFSERFSELVKPIRDRLVYVFYRLSAEGLKHLPERLAAVGATIGGLLLGALNADSRMLYARHLRRVLGPGVREGEIRRCTRRVFVKYGRYWLEGARVGSLPEEVVRGRFSYVSGYDHLLDAMKQGRGVVMGLPHVGSWEWGGAWLSLQGHPMTSVAEPLEPQSLYDYFVAQREGLGLRIVPLGPDASRVLMRTLHDGGLVGLLCDRDIMRNGVEVEFFGEKTTLPGGPATLALRTGAALIPAAVYQGPGRDHTAIMLPPVDCERRGSFREDVQRVMQALAHDLETLIRRAPDQWYVFQPNWPSDYQLLSSRSR